MDDLAAQCICIGSLLSIRQSGVLVALSRPVARLTRDSQLRRLCVRRASLAVDARFNSRRMTTAADDIPHLRPGRDIGRAYERGVAGHPALFRDQPRKRKTDLRVAAALRHPKHLHVVRSGYQADSNVDRFRGSFARRCGSSALHVHPELVALLTKDESIAIIGEHHVMEVRLDRIVRRDLCHRPVKASVPARELILMTRTAGLRADVPGRTAGAWQSRGEVGDSRLRWLVPGRNRFFAGTTPNENQQCCPHKQPKLSQSRAKGGCTAAEGRPPARRDRLYPKTEIEMRSARALACRFPRPRGKHERTGRFRMPKNWTRGASSDTRTRRVCSPTSVFNLKADHAVPEAGAPILA